LYWKVEEIERRRRGKLVSSSNVLTLRARSTTGDASIQPS